MTELELQAEAKRRVLRANPSLTPESFDAWLTDSLRNGATIVLTPDGALAAYPRESSVTRHVGPPTSFHELERA